MLEVLRLQMLTDHVPLEEAVAPLSLHASEGLRERILSLLSHTPVSFDDVAREADALPAQVQAVVIELELAGQLLRHAGGKIVLA